MSRLAAPARLLLLSLLLTLGAAPKAASAIEMVDPGLRWHTLTTPHFQITYHDGEETLAQRTANRAELIHNVLTRELAWTPGHRTRMVIIDRQDDANGYATPVPYNTIVLYAAPPDQASELDNYEDWLTMLVTHEYTHILHMDTISGLPLLARRVMGSIISPNSLLPRWVLEGFATLQETRLTLGGRGRSPWTDMMLRMAALEHRFPSIDQADGYGSFWPGGHLPYLWGVEFQQWVAAHYPARDGNRHGWTEVSHRNGAFPIPYLVGWHARETFGKTLTTLWREWRTGVEQQARAIQVERTRQGLTPSIRLSGGEGRGGRQDYGSRTDHSRTDHSRTDHSQTDHSRTDHSRTDHSRTDHGRDNGSQVYAMRVSPDGQRIVYSESSPEAGPRVISIDLNGGDRRIIDRKRLPDGFTFSADGQRVYFSAPALYDIYNRYNDLYQYDFKDEKLKRLTRQQRARDPEMSPDGQMLLFVTQKAGQTALAYTEIDGRNLLLTHDTDYTQYATPRFAPDGQSFVASVWKPGGERDIYRFSRSGEVLARLTADRAHDIDPTFSPDGRFVLFSSDRDGVPEIYALETATDRLFQVSRVLGGAFQPCVAGDGKALVFLSYHATGVEVHRMAYEPSSWVPVPRQAPMAASPQAAAPPLAAASPEAASPVAAASPEAASRGAASPDTADSQIAAASPDTADFPIPPLSWPVLRKLEPELNAARWPVDRYNPLPTLAPRFVAPFGYLTEAGAVGGLYTVGGDVLSKHQYGITLSYRTDDHYLGYGLEYINQQLPTPIVVNLSSYSVSLGRPRSTPVTATPSGFLNAIERAGYTYYDVRTRASIGLEFNFSRVSNAYLRYLIECRGPLDPLPGEMDQSGYHGNPFACPAPLEKPPPAWSPATTPARGRFAGLSFDYRWTRNERYARSISPERGVWVDVTAQLQSPWLGGDYTRALATLDARRYISLPAPPFGILHNQVLALRFSAGAALGDVLGAPTFRLGGSFGDNPALLFPDGYYPLRGYPVGASNGEAFVLGSAEYRLALWRIDRGLWTLPVFFRALSGALFVDAGEAGALEDFGGAIREIRWQSSLQGFKLGVGGELRADLVVSYGLPITVRSGIGAGLTEGGYTLQDLRGWYLQIGSYF